MTIFAKVQNGVLTLPAGTPPLLEGTVVQVLLPEPTVESDEEPKKSGALGWMLKYAGTVEGPEDWADEHDHYIHGAPRRKPKP